VTCILRRLVESWEGIVVMAIGLVQEGCGTVVRLVLEQDVVLRDPVVPDDQGSGL
jgi:hypothetical protein